MIPPLRKIVERGAGSSKLECGHVANTPRWNTKRVRCTTCLPLSDRQAYMAKNRDSDG